MIGNIGSIGDGKIIGATDGKSVSVGKPGQNFSASSDGPRHSDKSKEFTNDTSGIQFKSEEEYREYVEPKPEHIERLMTENGWTLEETRQEILQLSEERSIPPRHATEILLFGEPFESHEHDELPWWK